MRLLYSPLIIARFCPFVKGLLGKIPDFLSTAKGSPAFPEALFGKCDQRKNRKRAAARFLIPAFKKTAFQGLNGGVESGSTGGRVGVLPCVEPQKGTVGGMLPEKWVV